MNLPRDLSMGRLATATAAVLVFAACKSGSQTVSPPTGSVSVHVSSSGDLGPLASFSVRMRFWVLTDPPELFFEYRGSDLSPQLPCLVRDGVSLNQVSVEATVQFTGDPITYTAHAAQIFTCHPDADTPLTIPLDIIRLQGQGVGGTDVGVSLGGSTCSSTAVLRGDEVLAVCGSASCDPTTAAFLFASTCTALDGSAPDFWTCGPGDWSLIGPVARALFGVPPRDGSWTIGIAAFPRQVLAAPDPGLTDPVGNRRVYGAVGTPTATLVKGTGFAQPQLQAGLVSSKIALLDAGGGAQLLLEVDDAAEGSRAQVRTRFGVCGASALGVASWHGLHPIDARLDGLSAVKLTLSSSADGVASAQARCTAGLDGSNNPIATCSAAAPLGSAP